MYDDVPLYLFVIILVWTYKQLLVPTIRTNFGKKGAKSIIKDGEDKILAPIMI